MNAQHTPGPWMATVGNRGTLCVISGEAWICGELSNGNGEVPGEAEANARLIAAAPEMLAALHGMLSEWDKFTRYGSQIAKSANERINFAREIVAKAEGLP